MKLFMLENKLFFLLTYYELLCYNGQVENLIGMHNDTSSASARKSDYGTMFILT